MDILPSGELRSLVQVQTVGCICVSIYMPTFRPGRTEVQQNPVRLKKLLREAREKLIRVGLKRTEADGYLQPADRLLDDSFFWMNMSDGLVVFLSKDYFRYYRLPMELPELAVVANRLHLKPLLPLLAADGRFYVMAISQKGVRLLHCTRFRFDELDLAGKMPRSLAEALQYDDFDRESQYHHHLGRGVPSVGGGMITAHGPEVEETKENLLRFFFLVDRGLQREFLHNETAPLVMIGVDYLFPIYEKANTYLYLLDESVDGNPDKMSPAELHKQGLAAVEPYFKKRQEKAMWLYREAAGLGRTTTDLEKIVSDSYTGRVNVLFVAANQEKWGNYDPVANRVEFDSGEGSCAVDLLDFAAAHTLAHRGEVYAVETNEVPDGGPAAAVLRY